MIITLKQINNIITFIILILSVNLQAQNTTVNSATGIWSSLIQLDNFDPNDDQQSNADSDFVGNAIFPIIETQKETVSFNDGITDEVYYFRVRMGQTNPNTSFYFGIDVTGDFIADLFIEANVKSQTPYISFHARDQSKSGLSPSQTSWLNGTQNNELFLTDRNAVISDYSAGTDVDGGNSGVDYWIEFAFTEEILKAYVLDNFNLSISGDSAIALFGFTSTSQTSNGDVLGVDDTIPGILDKTWVELGIVINGSLNNITSGEIVTPTVNTQTTENPLPTITGTWGSSMLGDDSLSVTVDGLTYTTENGLIVDNLNWSLPLVNALTPNTYDVQAAASRNSTGQTVSDTTNSELIVNEIPDIPFNCDFNAYLFQYNDVYAIDLASGNSYQIAQDVTPGNINAAAYNPADGFIWGSLSSPEKTIVKIGKDFSTTSYYIDELPTNGRYVGDVSAQGIYYLKGGGTTYYKIDLDPESANYTKHQATESLSQNISVHDWAFNAVDNQLYTVEKGSNILYRINPSNGQVASLGVVPVLEGNNYTYGAVYFDADGRFYVSANQTGTIYVIQAVQNIETVSDIDSNLFAFGPSSASNDGARCPTAPVLQEICDNGIDDDGDGLIDCQDPSCSGFGSCEIITAPNASSSNSGGLESNSRLSDQINKRNFNRAKAGYTFNPSSARRVTRNASYSQRNSNNGFTLQDFIPLDVLGESEVIDASPTDLIAITNATEIYGVDYMTNDEQIASILALKTENGVYEHTKYICDRLLGAELISVSTIDINEQSFIKSIIKNVDGSYEFVLSLSAKVVNNDTNFSVESHWNLDKYEANTTFYNFQIWANTIDDLYRLGEEVLHLLNIEKPISEFNNSTPPTVFVRKGQYVNGALELQIVNTNATQNVTLDAGFRVTETEDFDNLNSTIDLNGQYITNITVETGSLFDIGFRIGDGLATPDDLFMSDGPWGIDDSQAGTSISNYTVTPNDYDFNTNDFVVERNVELSATTNSYVAAYRALTPRFKAVDLTDYNTFMFTAKGKENLEITFVKQSVTDWEAQYKTIIKLTDDLKDYTINLADLQNNTNVQAQLNDVVTIVFTMISVDGATTSKTMNLNNLRFSQANALSINEQVANTSLVNYPNPFKTTTTIKLVNPTTEASLVVYDMLGRVVDKKVLKTKSNAIQYNGVQLAPGIYKYTLSDKQNRQYVGTLVKK